MEPNLLQRILFLMVFFLGIPSTLHAETLEALNAQIKVIEETLDEMDGNIAKREALYEVSPQEELQEELKDLREEKKTLERLLGKLLDEVKADQTTPVDRALSEAQAAEKREEYHDLIEEALRDREE